MSLHYKNLLAHVMFNQISLCSNKQRMKRTREKKPRISPFRYGFKIVVQKLENNHIILHHRVVHLYLHLFDYHPKHYLPIQHHRHRFIICLMDKDMHQLHHQQVS